MAGAWAGGQESGAARALGEAWLSPPAVPQPGSQPSPPLSSREVRPQALGHAQYRRPGGSLRLPPRGDLEP